MTVGANEARGPFTVTASYYDEERKETKTATYAVTANVPAPLSPELSDEIRDKNIENIGLEGEYNDYETVRIDRYNGFVLGVDEENDRALLGWRTTSQVWFYEENVMGTHLWSPTWANSSMRLSYAQDRLKNNATVNAAAVTTDIYTRKPNGYKDNDQEILWKDVDNCGTITKDWIITKDKMFLFTEADIRGADAESHETLDYTYDGKAIIPRAILKAKADDTFVQWTVLRSLASESGRSAYVAVYHQLKGENDVLVDKMEDMTAFNKKTTPGQYSPFLGVWVQLSPEA